MTGTGRDVTRCGLRRIWKSGFALLLVFAALSGCKKPADSGPPVQAGPELEQAVIQGFQAVLEATSTCDPERFWERHTQKAQGAMEALSARVDPASLDPDVAAPGNPKHAGALWVCLLARMAGFVADNAKVERVVVNPVNGLAKVYFNINDVELGFPMARQFGIWRSPFPGQVFLVREYMAWQDPVMQALPDDAARDALREKLAEVVTFLEPFQPNWDEFPSDNPE
jgi:hypothetical protein